MGHPYSHQPTTVYIPERLGIDTTTIKKQTLDQSPARVLFQIWFCQLLNLVIYAILVQLPEIASGDIVTVVGQRK